MDNQDKALLNRISEEMHIIHMEDIWETVCEDIPKLRGQINELLNEFGE